MRKFLYIIVLILMLVYSCIENDKVKEDVEVIQIDLSIERFDQQFMSSTRQTLDGVKEKYPFLFPKRFSDSLWIAKIQDSLQLDLSNEINNVFNDFDQIESEIAFLFKHLKYYNSNFKTPRVITVFSDWDYRSKNQVTDSIILISLDTYLGKNHRFYDGVQKYLVQNFESNQIVPDLAFKYAEQKIPGFRRKTLLEEMIYYGKIYYFMDVMIPFKMDEEKIGYSKGQLDWAITNEVNIWTYFVENELLFNTDPKLTFRFINPAPFSKFNLELDRESPGRIARYMGWQIVRAYMKNNDVDLTDMLNTDATTIFNKAKFKPRK